MGRGLIFRFGAFGKQSALLQDFIRNYVDRSYESILEREDALAEKASVEEDVFAQDFMKFGKQYVQSGGMVTELSGLTINTRDSFRSAGAFGGAYIFYLELDSFLKDLQGKDVVFDRSLPKSEKAKDAMNFKFVLKQMRDMQKGINPDDGAARPLLVAMEQAGERALQALREVALESAGKEGDVISKEDAAALTQEERLNLFEGVEALECKLIALGATVENTAQFDGVQKQAIMLKELVGKEDLQDSELVAKNNLLTALESLKTALPPVTVDTLQVCTIDALKKLVGARKDVGDSAEKFFRAIQSADCSLSRFGKGFNDQIAQAQSLIKVLLGTQAALQVIKKNDPAKAASFEKEKLVPKGMSLAALPRSIVFEVTEIANRKQQ